MTAASPRAPAPPGAILGSLLGTAVGDALGLPREGLSPRRAERLFGPTLSHRFLPGRGMVSDDTEHACLVGQALLASDARPDAFARSLGWRLRGWLLGLPAGVGLATLRAVLKLWLGFPPQRSGVRSAGNGPLMRAPLLGVCLGDTPLLRETLRASTRITHTDPRAEEGALVVALAAHHGRTLGPGLDPAALLATLRAAVEGEELRRALDLVGEHLRQGSPPEALAGALGQARGISGYVNHTVPAVLYCWLRAPDDFAAALGAVVRLGGDADTTGAILGGIAGATLGAEGIPSAWVAGVREWPRSVAWLRRLAARLAERFPTPGQALVSRPDLRPVPLFWPGLPVRNALFLVVVLLHGLRRLLPPY